MSKFTYPALFTQMEDGIYVEFPDLPDVYTDGDSLPEAIEMAEDVLNLMIMEYEDRQEEFRLPSSVSKIPCGENQFVSFVVCDTDQYRQKYGSRSIKKYPFHDS